MPVPSKKITPLLILKMITDIFFLTRLFKVNRFLWFWEWLFHLTFILVIVRHLRYIINPVPEWLIRFQPFGIFSGYVLPITLLFIFLFKLKIEKKQYISGYNFFLLSAILFLSITGLLMRYAVRPDIANIKDFAIGLFSFRPVQLSDGFIFIIHFISALILLVYMPAHIFAAPMTMIEARRREEGLDRMMHED